MRLRLFGIGVALALVTLGALAFTTQVGWSGNALAGDPSGPGPGGGMMGMMHGMGDLPPALAFLREIPPEQRFAHFRGARLTLTDPNGNPVEVHFTPGTVASIAANGVTLTLNADPADPAAQRTFVVTPDTVVHAMPARGSLQVLAPGDRVVVATIGEQSGDAVAIFKHRAPKASRPQPLGSTPTPSGAAPGA